MNDKKNIDRFFQETLKDFESDPNERVWKKIQTTMNEKKQRKLIPFWIKFSGIAAAFLIGLFALNIFLNNNTDDSNDIILDQKVLKVPSKSKDSTLHKIEENMDALEIEKSHIFVGNKIETGKPEEKEIIPSNRFEVNSNKEITQTNAEVYPLKIHPLVKENTTHNTPMESLAVITEKNSAITHQAADSISDKPLRKGTFKENNDAKIAVLDTKKQTTTDQEAPNELEEILKNMTAENQTLALTQNNKWQITPNIATGYLNSNSGGSPIDAQFSENQKSAENSLSFGVTVHYAVSKKIALRSGINKLSLGYNTNNVIYSTGLANNNLTNINYTSNALIEIKNEAALNMLSSIEKDLQKMNTGALNQKMGYYEVPLELSYAVLDKKFGIGIIGGVSTLFLSDNKISLVLDETNIKLGEANNLNQIHFSTNVGIGFKYNIAKSFQINFEPMLKYHINTFSADSRNFKPIFIGLYSGVSYSF